MITIINNHYDYDLAPKATMVTLVSKVKKETPDDIFSTSDVNWMYEELHPFTQEDEETRQQHRSRDII